MGCRGRVWKGRMVIAGAALLEHTPALWRDSPAELPEFGWTIESPERERRERMTDEFLAVLERESGELPSNREQRASAHRRIAEAFDAFARRALLLTEAEIDMLLGRGLASIGTQLAREARRFAPRKRLVARLFEAFLAGEEDEPAFPLLPGAFLPRC
ncbi:MAG: hypothetical protein KatS3mg005_3569 [Bryobacteraceae bacterium]|nr:MAG: hypothetical protein KatS3mg005_3569 [Bryobacteraceae bacterium]